MRMLIIGFPWHSLGAAALRRSPTQSRLSLLLRPRSRRQGPGSLKLLANPPWLVPAKRQPAAYVRNGSGALPFSRVGWYGRFAVDASLIAEDTNKQRAVWEYLAILDDPAFGAASPVTPEFISSSDPAA